MAKHKIVAYRIEGSKTGVTIVALTESPRGTRIPFKRVEVSKPPGGKDEFQQALEQGLDKLVSSAE